MRPPRLVLLAAVSSLLLGLASGCSSDDSLVVYTDRDRTYLQPVLDKFAKLNKVTLDVRYGKPAELIDTVGKHSAKDTPAVYFAQDAASLNAVAKQGRFETLADSVRGRVPATFQPADKQWLGVAGREVVFTYNVNRIPVRYLPKTLADVNKPLFHGGVGIVPTEPMFVSLVSAMLVQRGEPATAQFLAAMKANGTQQRPDAKLLVDDVNVHHNIYAGLTTQYPVYRKTLDNGAVIDLQPARIVAFPAGDPGALMTVSGVGVIKHDGDNPLGVKLAEYLVGDSAQQYFAKTFEYPLLPTVAPDKAMPIMTSPKVDIEYLGSNDKAKSMIAAAGLLNLLTTTDALPGPRAPKPRKP